MIYFINNCFGILKMFQKLLGSSHADPGFQTFYNEYMVHRETEDCSCGVGVFVTSIARILYLYIIPASFLGDF